MRAKNTRAKSSALPASICAEATGATKVALVMALPVASIFAPLTTIPWSVSRSTWTNTSRISWIALLRSSGGLMIAWLRNSPWSAKARCQAQAFCR